MRKLLGIILAILFVIVFFGVIVMVKTAEGYELLEIFIKLGIAVGISVIILLWISLIVYLLVD